MAKCALLELQLIATIQIKNLTSLLSQLLTLQRDTAQIMFLLRLLPECSSGSCSSNCAEAHMPVVNDSTVLSTLQRSQPLITNSPKRH